MNYNYPIFLSICIFILTLFASCEQCDLADSYPQKGFNLEIRDANTNEHLFFGANPRYAQDEFSVFIKYNDSLSEYHRTIFEDENCFGIYSNSGFSDDFTFDKLADTFYIQVPNSPLDTLTIQYNYTTSECFGKVATSYDVQQNGILICESCNLDSRVIIFKD
jgi:hypothetical protein